jgi:hypothetical protein
MALHTVFLSVFFHGYMYHSLISRRICFTFVKCRNRPTRTKVLLLENYLQPCVCSPFCRSTFHSVDKINVKGKTSVSVSVPSQILTKLFTEFPQ